MIKLPIPIFHSESYYTDIQIKKPTPGILADTKRIATGGDVYSGLHKLIAGCTEAIFKETEDAIEDRVAISSLVRQMPVRSAEYIAMKIMLLLDPDDGIEGFYECPRCGQKVTAERKKDEDGEVIYDTRDFLRDLPVSYLSPGVYKFEYVFSSPVLIRNSATKDIVNEVCSFEMRYPTIAHCIAATQKANRADDMRFEWQVYIEAMETVDGEDANNNGWKNRFALAMLENISDPEVDLVGINKKVNEFGMGRKVRKICRSCDREWWQIVNTTNFFEFGDRTERT